MSEIISVVKYSNDDLDHQVFIHIGGKSYVIDRYSCFEKKSLTKQEAELICKRINTDVEKMVREMMEEYARKMIGIPHTPDYHMALQEVINRIEEGKCVDL